MEKTHEQADQREEAGAETGKFEMPAGGRGAAAAFKRNDKVLATMPRGILIFPGGGIQDNLFDKARAAGIAVIDRRAR